MEELFWWIVEIIGEWDTPAGPPDPEYCYGELVPKLKITDGKLDLYHDYLWYAPILKKFQHDHLSLF